jgi:hypothetical protein
MSNQLTRLLASAVLSAGLALPATITEIGDAGELLGTAQVADSQPGGTSLTNIYGFLESGGADLFRIYLTGGQTFSATTTLSGDANFFDSQLFLFDSAGMGIYANDDDDNSPPQSTLPASISFTPSASGTYYLAISGSGYLPASAGGSIFPVSGGLLDPTSGVVGPTGPGGGSALSTWLSTSSENGDYDIALTGAEFVPSAVGEIPEPSTTILLGAGLTAVALLRRKARG